MGESPNGALESGDCDDASPSRTQEWDNARRERERTFDHWMTMMSMTRMPQKGQNECFSSVSSTRRIDEIRTVGGEIGDLEPEGGGQRIRRRGKKQETVYMAVDGLSRGAP